MTNDKMLLESFRADDAEPSPSAIAVGRRRLLDHMAGNGRPTGSREAARPARRVGIAALAAAALLAGVPVAQSLTGGSAGSTAAAAELLNGAADSAMASPDPEPATGRFRYTHTIQAQNPSATPPTSSPEGDPPDSSPVPGDVLCFGFVEQWQSTSTDTLRVRRVDGILPGSAADPAAAPQPDPACTTTGSTTDQPGIDGPGSWPNPDAAFVAGLPTDPRRLYERAVADASAAAEPDGEAFVLLSELALSGSRHLTPEVRAAIFRAVALVPGVEVAGTGDNLFGDAGEVVAHDGSGMRIELIVDPSDGQVLGMRILAAEGNALLPAGTVLAESGARTAVVDAVGERPAW